MLCKIKISSLARKMYSVLNKQKNKYVLCVVAGVLNAKTRRAFTTLHTVSFDLPLPDLSRKIKD